MGAGTGRVAVIARSSRVAYPSHLHLYKDVEWTDEGEVTGTHKAE